MVLALLAGALATLSVSSALRDVEPPRLYYEVENRLPVGASALLFVSANEPVTYVVSYAGDDFRAVDQDHTFVLDVAPGVNEASVAATDASGNETVVTVPITGIEPVRVRVDVAERVRAGDPLGVLIDVSDDGAGVTGVGATFADAPVRLLETADGYRAVVPTPFEVEESAADLIVDVTDEFGRHVSSAHHVVLDPLPVSVEQLRIPASVLSAVTPEAQAQERQLMEEGVAAGGGPPKWTEPFLMPITGTETSGFADARRYAEGGPVSYHNGLDLAAPMGTPVHATNDGVVVVAGQYAVKGGWVMLDHGFGVYSHYFHMSRVDVEPGQRVARGDVIGLVGTTGLSTGPHLHWEMRLDLAPSNPLLWADKVWP